MLVEQWGAAQRQLEKPFRQHLENDAPCGRNAQTEGYEKVREEMQSFAYKCTDNLFRLGLALKMHGKTGAGYLAIHTRPSQEELRYRVLRASDGCGQLGLITDWQKRNSADRKKTTLNSEAIELQDAAPPDGQNALAPGRKK